MNFSQALGKYEVSRKINNKVTLLRSNKEDALDNAKGVKPLGFIDMPAIQKGLRIGDEIRVVDYYLNGKININAPAKIRCYIMQVIEVSEAYYRVVPKSTVYNSIITPDRGSFLISRNS